MFNFKKEKKEEQSKPEKKNLFFVNLQEKKKIHCKVEKELDEKEKDKKRSP